MANQSEALHTSPGNADGIEDKTQLVCKRPWVDEDPPSSLTPQACFLPRIKFSSSNVNSPLDSKWLL
jgi:hypothetical protein